MSTATYLGHDRDLGRLHLPGVALGVANITAIAQATLNVTEEQKQRLLDARRALIKRVEGIVSERRSVQTATWGLARPGTLL